MGRSLVGIKSYRSELNPADWKLAFFGLVAASQVGHLAEHILVKVTGAPFLGSAANTEETHLLFNTLIVLFALGLVRAFPANPWVYPLALLSVFHGIEHVYIFEQYLRTRTVDGPGLLGMGGVFGLIPLNRLDLHNVYNGLEMILIVLGFGLATEQLLETEGS